MRRVSGWVRVIGFGLLSAASTFVLAEETGVKTVDAAWMKAMRANDVDGVIACYAPDAVMWLPDAPAARGMSAIREAYAGWLSANRILEVSVSNTQSITEGRHSFGWGEFFIRMQPKKGGDSVELRGRFTSMARRDGDRWLYAVDHASNDPAPAK